MTQEDKQLLIKDLCGRLPYGVKINIRSDYTLTMEDMELNAYHLYGIEYNIEYRGLRPYLRPMSSMTEEEEDEYIKCGFKDIAESGEIMVPTHRIDFLNAHYFDYRIVPSTGKSMIESGLAHEAPEGMYKIE